MKNTIKELYKKDKKLAVQVAKTLGMEIITSSIKQDVGELSTVSSATMGFRGDFGE